MYPKAYIEYIAHFHGDRDYFECHEILEEYWKQVDSRNKESIWVGFIQLAVSCYHHRRGNMNGAKRTLEKALEILTASEADVLTNLGLDQKLFISLLQQRLSTIIRGMGYSSMNLPIHDSTLLNACKETCHRLGFVWGEISDMSNVNLIHRHKLRDRTEVIEERKQALNKKKATN